MRLFTILFLITFLSIFISCNKKTEKYMDNILIIGKLNIESSYVQNIERKSNNRFDTVQFYISPESSWRIKTFSIDNDIHVYKLGKNNKTTKNLIDFFKNNIKKSYSDVLEQIYVINLPSNKKNDILEILKLNNLNENIEINDSGLIFWNPDNSEYKTISNPSGN